MLGSKPKARRCRRLATAPVLTRHCIGSQATADIPPAQVTVPALVLQARAAAYGSPCRPRAGTASCGSWVGGRAIEVVESHGWGSAAARLVEPGGSSGPRWTLGRAILWLVWWRFVADDLEQYVPADGC